MADPDWVLVAVDQLNRLHGKERTLKRATVLALADARIAKRPEAEVWDRDKHPEVCSKNTYYKWLGKDPVFADVLQQVTALAQNWKDTRALRALQQAAEDMALAAPLAAAQLKSIATAGQVRRVRTGPNGKPQVFTEPAATPDVLRATIALLDRAGMQTAAKSVSAAAALDADQLAALLAQAKADAAEIERDAVDGWNPDAGPDEGGEGAADGD